MTARGKKTAVYSPKVDVYSYGIILWEFLELSAPWSHASKYKFPTQIYDAVERGERPPIAATEASAPGGFVALLKRCWDQDPIKRPVFDKIKDDLDQIMKVK